MGAALAMVKFVNLKKKFFKLIIIFKKKRTASPTTAHTKKHNRTLFLVTATQLDWLNRLLVTSPPPQKK